MQALTEFIPIQAGQTGNIVTQKLISDLLGQIGYEPPRDGYIIFTEDLLGRAIPIPYVDMQLVVMDLDKYSDYDMLPLSADMAAEVILQTMQILVPTPPHEAVVDSTTEEEPKKR